MARHDQGGVRLPARLFLDPSIETPSASDTPNYLQTPPRSTTSGRLRALLDADLFQSPKTVM